MHERAATTGFQKLFTKFQPVELAFSKMKGHFMQLWPWEKRIDVACQEKS
jgi:hypothetical protein